MTIETAVKLVRRCSYKPGWKLSALSIPYKPDYVRLIAEPPAELVDVDQPSKAVPLRFYEDVFIKTQQPVGLLFALIRMIEMAERHELREWFKFDGIKVSNPHDEELL